MRKRKPKYYYVIVRKDNGQMHVFNYYLPLFQDKSIAKNVFDTELSETSRNLCVLQKILISDIEDLILKSKKA